MPVIKCSNCGEEASSTWKKCPHCGKPLKGKRLKDPSPRLGCFPSFLIIIFIAAVMLYAAMYHIGWGDELLEIIARRLEWLKSLIQ